MPANAKYLNKSPWQQFAKILAGLIGGYIITALVHMCLPLCLPYPKEVLVTSIFSFYIVWCVFMILPFLYDNGWKACLLYLLIIALLSGVFYFVSQNNPFV